MSALTKHSILTKYQVKEILSKRFENESLQKLSHLPPPDSFKDIEKAALRIKKAILNGEKILIVGDYDADGVISAVLMKEFFEDIKYENIEIYLPDRFEDGYGVSEKIVEKFCDFNLIITVDNGISAVEAAQKCKFYGIDLIITDHHLPPQILPQAYAIINPKQPECLFPYSGICGAQVAWYFIATLKKVFNIEKYDLTKFLDLLAVAIMADMMELVQINRTMVRAGMGFLNSSKRASFVALKNRFNKNEFAYEDISFLIAPLINGAGRVDSAMWSFKFLSAKNINEADFYLQKLINFNEQRKDIEQQIYNEALELVNPDKNIIVAFKEGWHEGVLGIVASRLARKFSKIAFALTTNTGNVKGSARGVENINITNIIEKGGEFLLRYGGHKKAAGVSLLRENLDGFVEFLENYQMPQSEKTTDQSKGQINFYENRYALGELNPKCIDLELLDIIDLFAPFGEANPEPSFILKGAKVTKAQFFSRSNYKKMKLQKDKIELDTIFFEQNCDIDENTFIDIIFTLTRNTYGQKHYPQLLIKQILSYK